MSKSVEKEDWLGNKYTEHYGDDGNKIGESWGRKDWLGNNYTEHRDSSDTKTGESRDRKDWLANDYTEHRDSSGTKTGESGDRKDWLGNDYTEHRDSRGDKVGESRERKDWLGNNYVEHTGPAYKTSRSRSDHRGRTTAGEDEGSSSGGYNRAPSDSSDSYDVSSSYSSSPAGTTGGLFPAVIVVGLVLIGLALFQSPSTVEQRPTASSPVNWASSPKLSLKDFGPIRTGMTLAEARSAAADPLIHDPSEGQDCFYVKPTGAPDGLAFMVTDGRISRVDITSPSYSSMSGARVGQTQDQVIQLYSGKLEITEHKYDDNGRYLTYIPTDIADQPYRMVFETDGNRITRFRAGKLPEVQYVEGCL